MLVDLKLFLTSLLQPLLQEFCHTSVEGSGLAESFLGSTVNSVASACSAPSVFLLIVLKAGTTGRGQRGIKLSKVTSKVTGSDI